jgi:predicted nucleic acid-binding protein
VLVEVVNALSSPGTALRRHVGRMVRDLLEDPQVEVVLQSHSSFLTGLELHEKRPDKGYSLTDCISMQVMKERGITEALTHDHHYEQEGFITLIRIP